MPFLTDILSDPSVQFGLGLLASNQGRNRQEAFGNVLQGGLQTYGWGRQLQANQALAAMRAMEIQQKVAQQQRLQGLLAGLPENERAMATLSPEGWAKAKLGQQYPEVPAEVRTLQALQGDPGLLQTATELRRAGSSQVNVAPPAVNIGMPFQPGTEEGKRIADRMAFVNTYGEGSPQVSQFDQESAHRTTTAEEAGKSAQSEIAAAMLRELRSLTLGPDAKVELGPKWGRDLAANQGMMGYLFRSVGGGLGKADARAVALTQALSNTLLQAMRGAQVGPMEQERFNKQLPLLDQDPDQFEQNLELTLQNINELNRRSAELRGRKAVERPSVPTGSRPSTRAGSRPPPPPGFTIPLD